MTWDDREYHERRARQELMRAALAATDGALRSHRALAELHLSEIRSEPLVAANDPHPDLVAG